MHKIQCEDLNVNLRNQVVEDEYILKLRGDNGVSGNREVAVELSSNGRDKIQK